MGLFGIGKKADLDGIMDIYNNSLTALINDASKIKGFKPITIETEIAWGGLVGYGVSVSKKGHKVANAFMKELLDHLKVKYNLSKDQGNQFKKEMWKLCNQYEGISSNMFRQFGNSMDVVQLAIVSQVAHFLDLVKWDDCEDNTVLISQHYIKTMQAI